jgi:curved DNA-binding protein
MFGDMFSGRQGARGAARKGTDLAATITVDFASAIAGHEMKLALSPGREVAVRVPAGAGDGDKLRVAGQGGPAPRGGAPGDLIIEIKVTAHPYFERKGLDLHLDLPITVKEAYDGAKVAVPTPEGTVSLKVPAGAKSGQVVRLKGKGVKRQKKVGELFVRFLIQLPEVRSEEVTDAIEALSDATSDTLREGIIL